MRQHTETPLPNRPTQVPGPRKAGAPLPPAPDGDFPERHDDPEQVEELERQQDA